MPSFVRRTELGLLLAIVVVVAVSAALDQQHNYWHQPLESGKIILRQTSLLGITALGAAIVIIAGGIDLSIGSVIAFSGSVCACFLLWLDPAAMQGPGEPHLSISVITLAIAGTLLVGFLIGSLHAWLITVVGLPPFIATLASLVGLRSLARALVPAVQGYVSPGAGTQNQINIFDSGFRYLETSIWVPAVVFLALAAVCTLVLTRTVVGRHLVAMGGNEQAARLSGIRTDRLKWLAYCASAMLSSVAGILYVCAQSVAKPEVLGMGYELNAIAAAVVGGCSLQGGVGTIPGAMLGALFLRTVIDGIAKVIDRNADMYEGFIVGVLVVLAVSLSKVRGAGGSRKRFFPGALGAVMVVLLALLAAMIASFFAGPRAVGIAFGATLAGLGAVKYVEGRATRRR
jgi:ribose/xylose/arabinose/galactoside ABC-type transport system permease subunit